MMTSVRISVVTMKLNRPVGRRVTKSGTPRSGGTLGQVLRGAWQDQNEEMQNLQEL